jgi:hypothetical protein
MSPLFATPSGLCPLKAMNLKRPRAGAYSAPGGKKTTLSVFAFADILGFGHRIGEADADGSIDELLNRATRFLKPWRRALQDRSDYRTRRESEIKLFSDNIAIAHLINDDLEDAAFGAIFDQLGLLQIDAAHNNFFVRGGISVGRIYVDNDIVFGLPLVDAHLAETTTAKWPRLILTSTAREFVAARVGPARVRRHSPYYRDLLIDEDGQMFLHYLAQVDKTGETSWASDHRDSVQKALDRFGNNERFRVKYEWLARYHNFWCGQAGHDAFLIDGHDELAARRLDQVDDLGACPDSPSAHP